MSKTLPPELTSYLGTLVEVNLNANRTVQGRLTGFDHFMNLTLENCVEVSKDKLIAMGITVVRGNSIVSLEQVPSST
ncbi:hypothetical protein P9112_014584 [Eukaryota sp. TZLM1-RC]